MNSPGTVERAFQLARSGRFENVTALENALSREGLEGARAHLAGAGIRAQLAALLRDAARVDDD
jgi:hypothetical protein